MLEPALYTKEDQFSYPKVAAHAFSSSTKLVPTQVSRQFNLCCVKAVNAAIGGEAFQSLSQF